MRIYFYGLRIRPVRALRKRTLAAHARLELTQFLVEHKQLFGQDGLVGQHVDQQPHGAQAADELGDQCVRRPQRRCARGKEQLNVGTHAQSRQGRLVQAEHGKHAPHLPQARRDGLQNPRIRRISNIAVQRFFDFSERQTQFRHHRAHGFAVAHAAVQLFHPAFDGLGCAACAGLLQPRRQTRAALFHRGACKVQVRKDRFKVQQGGRHFHCHGGAGRCARTGRRLGRCAQCSDQGQVVRVQFGDALGHLCKLLGNRAKVTQVTASQRRPAFCGTSDVLAHQGQLRGIKPAKRGRLVVDTLVTVQAIGTAHRLQQGRIRLRGWIGQCAKEHQILHRRLKRRCLAGGHQRILRHDFCRAAPHINVVGQARQGDRFKEAGGHGPITARLQGRLSRRKACTQMRHLRCMGGVQRFENWQQCVAQARAQGGRIVQGFQRTGQLHRQPVPLALPKVGRVDAFGAAQLHDSALLGKQRNW